MFFRRFTYSMFVLLGVVVLVFLLFQGFGDPARLVMGQRADQKTRENIRKDLGLDQPRWKQFLYYVNDISPICVHHGNTIRDKQLKGIFFGNGDWKFGFKRPYLRRSYQTRREVGEMIAGALPGTLLLASAAIIFATIMGIAAGVLSAVYKDTWVDGTTIFASILGISAPSFFMAIAIAYLFGFLLHDITGLYMTGSWFDLDSTTGKPFLSLGNLWLPAITLGIRPLAIIAQLTRASLLDTLQQDYVRTAVAKGLPRWKVIWKHALRNALNPVITAITGWFAELLAGAFFVEYIFGWKGLGKLTVDALAQLDFPVVMGAVLVSACFFVLVNFLADVLYRWVDPRMREIR
ncbi:ABC transporter permease [Flavihumibacter petaseus]|uniref:Putative ABC transporter permease protein n=1 Tax=Flavihumibacter petaseus NBRC 106054 TaxID=1220578 RepID=A0A0E9N766_9BACT|nr:ABC transporter permease [Flavihumibacter petaseus]GAO45643.1 putative ABC transporter permease protein [Flavihumibacter petaseus NBRC 106054]